MKRRHLVGVSMARRVDVVRPRELRDVLEHTDAPHDPPRRLTPAGRVVVAGLVAAIAAFALFYALAERIGGHL